VDPLEDLPFWEVIIVKMAAKEQEKYLKSQWGEVEWATGGEGVERLRMSVSSTLFFGIFVA